MFDFMTNFGARRTPFSLKDVFDCTSDSMLGMQSSNSMFESPKYKCQFRNTKKSEHSLKKIWYEVIKDYSMRTNSNLH